MVSTTDLPGLLRRSTADLHRDVEEAVGLPGSVKTREDYVALLRRLHEFHCAVERTLEAAEWAPGWAALGIDLSEHRRARLLRKDLAELGHPVADESTAAGFANLPAPRAFGEALGYLYVVEGSALGGRVLGPAIRAAVPGMPMAFFESEGRAHPGPWRRVKEALFSFGVSTASTSGVELGARNAFLAFGRHLDSGLWSSAS